MASELHLLEEGVRGGRKGESDFSRLPLFSTLSIHSSRHVLAVQLRRSGIVLCKSTADTTQITRVFGISIAIFPYLNHEGSESTILSRSASLEPIVGYNNNTSAGKFPSINPGVVEGTQSNTFGLCIKQFHLLCITMKLISRSWVESPLNLSFEFKMASGVHFHHLRNFME
ncbi:hypothetical protein J1N35_035500 [Gossypium stocksii]|uniref:Uncharacterized protein n=1 Tax=Gossypium stocksii TaxID=47602 RepID=A0A9D3UU31_9ROSI|nr:hypothetical protein J1N35_035500 [Gossypium stocksii]